MRRNRRKGQSILEYTLLLGAIIAVLVIVLLNEGGIKGKVQASYQKVGTAVENTTNDLTTGVFQ
jgi:Flp pilus assembly pilin Flp